MEYLSNYDVVLIYSNFNPSYYDVANLGNKFKAYVDNGGALLVAARSEMEGAIVDDGYLPLTIGEYLESPNTDHFVSLAPGVSPDHLLAFNMFNEDGTSRFMDRKSYRNVVTPSQYAEVIMNWESGEEFLAVNEIPGLHPVISLNFVPLHYLASGSFMEGGEQQLLNAILYSACTTSGPRPDPPAEPCPCNDALRAKLCSQVPNACQ